MTRMQRIVLRHQVDARRRELLEGASPVGPKGEVSSEDLPGAWMPQCRVPSFRGTVLVGPITKVAVRH